MNLLTINNVKIGLFNILVCIQILLLSNITELTNGLESILTTLSFAITFLFVLMGVIVQKTKAEWCWFILLFMSSMLPFLMARVIEPIQITSFIFGLKGVKNTKLMRTLLFTSSFTFILISILNFMGIVDSSYVYRHSSAEYRDSLGFIHPNTAGNILFTISSIYILVKNNSFKKINYIVLLLPIAVSIFVLDSRTSSVVLIIMFTLVYFSNNFNVIRKKMLWGISSILFLFINVFTVFTMYNFNNNQPFWQRLDGLLSGRLFFINEYFKKYGLSIFGQSIEFGEELARSYGFSFSYFGIDSGYARILINYGVLFYILFLLLFLHLGNLAYRSNNTALLIIGMGSMLFISNENFLINNVSLFIYFISIKNKHITQEGENHLNGYDLHNSSYI